MAPEIHRFLRQLVWLCTCLGVMGASGGAQDRKAEALRDQFRKESGRRVAPQLTRYIRKLSELESLSSDQRDYALVGRIRAEYLAAVERWHEVSGSERGDIGLDFSGASLAGGVTLKEDGTLVNWASPGAEVSWNLPPGVLSGAYSVSLEYQLEDKPTAVVFSSGHFNLNRELERSDGKFNETEFHPLLLNAGATAFSIKVGGEGAAALIVRSVALKKRQSGMAHADGSSDAAIESLKAMEPEAMQKGKRDAALRLYFVLVDLERQFAKAGQYEGAIAMQEEMAALVKIHGPLALQIEAGPQEELVLKPEQARTTGAIRYDRAANVLVGWKNEGNVATWDVRNVDPGRYEVVASYGVSDSQPDPNGGSRQKAGGSFIIRQSSGLVGEGAERITHRVALTGGWNKFALVECGQMTISRTSATIVVECATAEELGVMHLRGIELRKVSTLYGDAVNVEARFATLRSAHVREIDALLMPIEKDYVAALKRDEDDPLAKSEIDRVRGDAAARKSFIVANRAGESRVAEIGEHVLPATDNLVTFLSGQAAVHSSGEFITGLRPPDAYVQWNLNRLRVAPGDYTVSVQFRTTEKMGGEFRIVCGSAQVVDRIRIGPFGNLNRDFRSRLSGSLRITEAARTIRFEPIALDARDGVLCDLRSITLKPTTAAIGGEQKHADGYVEWNGVTFVKNARNTGDSILVHHREENRALRLFAVTCPPRSARAARGEDLKGVRDHFGVSANDLARGGRHAAQMTEDLLSRAPFTVFTKGEKAANGALFAWVLLKDDTLLSGRLVEKGLAGINGEPGAVPESVGRGIDSKKYQSWLRAREKEAEEKKDGIWRYQRG